MKFHIIHNYGDDADDDIVTNILLEIFLNKFDLFVFVCKKFESRDITRNWS